MFWGVLTLFCNENLLIFPEAQEWSMLMFTENKVTSLKNGTTRYFPNKWQISKRGICHVEFLFKLAMPHLLMTSRNEIICMNKIAASDIPLL